MKTLGSRFVAPVASAVALACAHALLGSYLAARDPLASVLMGQLGVAVALVVLFVARLGLLVALPAWLLFLLVDTGIAALERRRRVPARSAQAKGVPGKDTAAGPEAPPDSSRNEPNARQ